MTTTTTIQYIMTKEESNTLKGIIAQSFGDAVKPLLEAEKRKGDMLFYALLDLLDAVTQDIPEEQWTGHMAAAVKEADQLVNDLCDGTEERRLSDEE